MASWSRENLSAIVSVTSGLALLFTGGVLFGYKGWPPTPLIDTAHDVLRDLAKNGHAYFLGIPTQHTEPRKFPGDGVVIYNPDEMVPGTTFMTGLFGNRLGARLYAADGTLLHEWPVDFFKVAPELMSYPFDALVHGDHLYESGDFVINLDGRKIMRVSACGEIVWQNQVGSHHSLDVDDEGYIWAPTFGPRYQERRVLNRSFAFDRVAKYDPLTGEKMAEVDLVKALIEADLVGLATTNRVKHGDVIHLNDVEVLSADMAAAFPKFSAGDLLLSSRHFNQIWVIDGGDYSLKWWFSGPMIGQHDPDFQPDGTITLFDNRPSGGGSLSDVRELATDPEYIGDKGGSRILSVDPETGRHQTLYESDERNTFYTPYRGKHQVLESGNILITETDVGRAFEVTPEGEVVWSFINGWDETHVGWLMKATRYPESFAEIGDIACEEGAGEVP